MSSPRIVNSQVDSHLERETIEKKYDYNNCNGKKIRFYSRIFATPENKTSSNNTVEYF